MRSFIALEFDEKLKDKLLNIQSNIKEEAIKGSWISYDNFHLTLKFLGDINIEDISQIEKTLEKIVTEFNPIHLTLDGLGFFKGNENIRVLWLGTRGDTKILSTLHRRLEDEVVKIGFKRENRRFKPHITLARRIVLKKDFYELKDQLNKEMDYDFTLSKINLMKSEEIMGKRVYTPLKSYKLKKTTTE
ncbi:MAG: RNA 2',3'-cyclic phosphodiesterase [Clostridiaceae bacterium]|nr:RNA 2',3'-cyclic phosphodiesterase [Clostridiaceae bacterium]MBW4858574.1 RNA 2',3'-cyclic phosphodiesterase [Clostridiaceae bacterium]MBW4868268.1 RNA 2',3'-cyclic phosphodiesterase [Clostridiaceae bacterium]